MNTVITFDYVDSGILKKDQNIISIAAGRTLIFFGRYPKCSPSD
jgi:hypothetical protein